MLSYFFKYYDSAYIWTIFQVSRTTFEEGENPILLILRKSQFCIKHRNFAFDPKKTQFVNF